MTAMTPIEQMTDVEAGEYLLRGIDTSTSLAESRAIGAALKTVVRQLARPADPAGNYEQALTVISNMPIAEQDNMISANMRSVARFALNNSNARPADPTPPQTREEETESTRGHVIWHCTDEDGGPDVGLSIGLGDGKTMWAGEISDDAYDDDAKALSDIGGWWLLIYPDRIPLAKFVDAEMARDFIEKMTIALAVRDEAVRMFPAASGEVFGWQTMETAPLDGDEVDLFAGGRRWTDCHYHCEEWLFWDTGNEGDNTHRRVHNPTHWMRVKSPGFTLLPTDSAPASEAPGARDEDVSIHGASAAGESPAPDYLTIGLEAARLHWALNAATVGRNDPQKIAIGKQAVALHQMVAKAAEGE